MTLALAQNRCRSALAGAALAFLCAPSLAQPIFTTAPTHLQRLRPTEPAQPSVDTTPAPPPAAPAPQGRTLAPVIGRSPTAPAPQHPQAQLAPSAPQRLPIPGIDAPAAPAAPQAAPIPAFTPAATPTPAAQAAVTPGETVIRHLTNNVQGFRLAGEIGSSEWPVFFTPAQTQRALTFQLGYLSAVSVMPEASTLKLVVNDQVVGKVNIRPTRGVGVVTFQLPQGVVQPGFNSVRIVAEHRHRVDCSLTATYELWTQIDPTQTGFVLPRDASVATLTDLAALPPDEQGALPVRVVLASKTTPSHIQRILHAVQAISLVGRFEQPVVDVGAPADGAYGVNLAIGPGAELAGLLGEPSLVNAGGPRVVVLPANARRRTTIAVTGMDDTEVDQAMRHFDFAAQLRGTPAGLRAAAAFPGYRIEGGQRVKLREFGLVSEEFSGRLFRAAFNLIMPPDFYSADYGKATLDLAGGYAPGLTNAAQIIVSVNGRNAVSLKMPKASGDVFKQNPIPLQLGHLRPGLNRIEIEVQTPVAEDEACDPLAAIAGRKRFLFLDTTEFELPRIARIARVPDLAVTATGGFPFNYSTGAPATLYVPVPDRNAIGAAATMVAHLAIAAGAPLNFRFATERPAVGSGPVLALAPLLSFDADTLNAVGLRHDELHALWQDKIYDQTKAPDQEFSRYDRIARDRLVLQRNFPAACHMQMPAGGFRTALAADRMPVASVTPKEEKEKPDLFTEWDNKVRSQSRVFGYVTGFFKTLSDWTQGKFSGARVWIDEKLDMNSKLSPITRASTLVVAQNILGASTDHVWTIVTAPNTSQLAQSMNCLVDPRVWRQIAGKIAVLNPGDGAIVSVPEPDARLIVTQPLSIQNTRLIIAGWFSLNGKIYVLFSLVLAMLLAWTTRRFVSQLGRKAE